MNDHIIFNAAFPRTSDALVERFAQSGGARIEAWTFDDKRSRDAAAAELARRGVNATFRSAYKPLLHFFLEEAGLEGLTAIDILYPVHDRAPANRFTLEAWPLAGLTGDAHLSFTPRDDGRMVYDVTLVRAGGGTERHEVFVPCHVHGDINGEICLSPTGWLIGPDGGEGERMETDYEQLFAQAMTAIGSHDWGTTEPYFGELNIAATLPLRDAWLGFHEEAISLSEALHEDFYFSCLEFFQKKSGRPSGDRGLRPGQIVPEIAFAEGPASVRITTRQPDTSDATGPDIDLDLAARPLFVSQIAAELAAVGGKAFSAVTRTGRPVDARYIRGRDVAVMISAGQHANETTGIVGALRAARVLKQRESAHFTLSPLENPDGYALHHRLRAENPRHMHHAARYTALGDDLEYRDMTGTPPYEKEIRLQAIRLAEPQLHINLHGYPAHEWTRPLSGYVPRNFAMWTLPKGFFFILRHHAAWAQQAERLMERVTADAAKVAGLREFSQQQASLYERHAGGTGFRTINGFACMMSVDERSPVPVTLITEYPDETIYDDAFIAGHTAQMHAVISAYEAWQEIMLTA